MKIVSRLSQENDHLEIMQAIIAIATNGEISEGGATSPAASMDEAISQIDTVVADLLTSLDDFAAAERKIVGEMITLGLQLAQQEEIIDFLRNVLSFGIDYDDALDNATLDFMDVLLASGTADPTADGEITFPEKLTLTKEDLKPLVRQAISGWLNSKIRSI